MTFNDFATLIGTQLPVSNVHYPNSHVRGGKERNAYAYVTIDDASDEARERVRELCMDRRVTLHKCYRTSMLPGKQSFAFIKSEFMESTNA